MAKGKSKVLINYHTKMGFGDYPAEYNPKVHGVYDPARFYGKRKFLFNHLN